MGFSRRIQRIALRLLFDITTLRHGSRSTAPTTCSRHHSGRWLRPRRLNRRWSFHQQPAFVDKLGRRGRCSREEFDRRAATARHHSATLMMGDVSITTGPERSARIFSHYLM